ncbi:2,3-bisphosphoglycerate-independent phosphoglycerate mutase [Portibacter lacus]|uniref:2,3-bisphosphoglycerate-independent phosphoglycerate mutase n=1 Tax=Portibacter lacus TaxID=1099794 RepID=A0AA37SSQ4_9BACT|nr:2,3-bisphosphoglycerate-independent phosphoglycerate mutase [Portibacter lacus]GLR18955.1 2,3-bisphosphoglycerate-independent phosphoglycerate mutase [Portibacter lacus]
MANKKAILLILDGWGHGKNEKVSAIAQANTPFIDSLYKDYPNAELVTFGMDVGLPEGQMGNSEVGHLNIGAGRVVYQDFTRINKAIADGEFEKNEVLVNLLTSAKKNNKTVHLMGLLSDGGVHSHIKHLEALIDVTEKYGLEKVFIHAFLDGRDTDPKAGEGYLRELLKYIDLKNPKLASIIGRYYAMDRDTRWERTQKAYDLIVKGIADFTTDDPVSLVAEEYKNGKTDEFMPAIKVNDTQIKDGDVVIFFNYRTDRPRQITEVLTQKDHPEFGMKKLDLEYGTMTTYDANFKNIKVLFTKDNLKNTMGEVVANAGLTQVRIAETEKYPHVTFFFSGGREKEFAGETRILVPSPKVATYDLQPEMSAEDVKSKIIAEINANLPDFVCLNFANTDMVGHTGDFKAAQVAAEKVDDCVRQIVETGLKHDYEFIIIADHGNSDYMINDDGTPNTAHTVNMVPIFYVSNHGKGKTIETGKLADVANTLLSIMEVDIPKEMTGTNLIK